MKKLNLILDDTNWLEATWVEEIINQTEDGESTVETKQVHCESFSGHREHIEMLRAKALEFGTELDEALISECIANFKYPTEEELAQQELEAKIAGAKAEIARQLETLTVTTTNGNTFDADNQARLDMQNAITASDFVGATETTWRMADDNEVLIELSELKEALALAIQEYARVKGIGA